MHKIPDHGAKPSLHVIAWEDGSTPTLYHSAYIAHLASRFECSCPIGLASCNDLRIRDHNV